jgi:4,5-DOPA dioxygenase extradiol
MDPLAGNHRDNAIDIAPAIFVSHGAPSFAIEPGIAGPLLSALGRAMHTPRAILVLSPHWQTQHLNISSHQQAPILHDYSGFPAALYQLDYPAPGEPALAAIIAATLHDHGHEVALHAHRGLDHGAWVPLRFLFPEANVPVVQLSMPRTMQASDAYQLGEQLRTLRKQGVMILGSGSLTHNLYEVQFNANTIAPEAQSFVTWIQSAMRRGDQQAIVNAMQSAPEARRAHPTIEHYLPLPFVVGASFAGESATLIEGGFAHGVLSMHGFAFGV